VQFQRVLKDPLNHPVGKFAQRVKSFPCARTTFKLFAYARSFVLALGTEDG
jgi:hypothetical protein